MVHDVIDIEGIQFAGPMAVDRLPDLGDESSQLGAVESHNFCSGRLTHRLVGHNPRVLAQSKAASHLIEDRPLNLRHVRAFLALVRCRHEG